MTNKALSNLKSKHSKLHCELNETMLLYKNTKNLLETNLIFFTKEEMKETQSNYKKTMKVLSKKYLKIRENIYSIEDEIAEIDIEILEDIIKPMPESIEYTV